MANDNWRGLKPNHAVKIFRNNPNVPTKRFEPKDFVTLVKAFSEVCAKWESIAGFLLPSDTANQFKKRYRTANSALGLIHVLDGWMKRGEHHENLYPCWWSVVYVVADSLGGGNPAAAKTIAMKWEEYERRPLSTVALNGDERPLDETKEIISELAHGILEVAHRWFEVGTLIGVPLMKLEIIAGKHFNSEEEKLQELIEVWLGLFNDPSYYFTDLEMEPTIQMLIDAVAHLMGGGNEQLAIKMTAKHPSLKDTSTTKPPSSCAPPKLENSIPTITTGDSSIAEEYFPYLKVDHLSNKAKKQLVGRLTVETDAIRDEYAKLVTETTKSLTSTIKSIPILKIVLESYKISELNECDVEEILQKAFHHCWFFSFRILRMIIDQFGTSSDKERLEKYEKHFKEFCQRRLSEVPIDALNPPGKSKGTTFYIKTDKTPLYIYNIYEIQSELTRLLKKPVYLRSVEDGCIVLGFYILHKLIDIFPLSKEQKNQLKEIGVIRVYNEHKEYYSLSKGHSAAAVAVEFSAKFSPKELAAWLRNKFVKKEICDIIEKEEIAGRVFLTISDDEWKEDCGIKRGADRRMLTSLQEEIKGTVTNSPAPAHGSDGGIPQKPHQKPDIEGIDNSTELGMNDVVDIEKFISTLNPNEVRDLGKNLGLNPIELKKMNDTTLNGDMIEAWINNEDKPTWRAFAKGLDLIKKGKFVRQIKEAHPSQGQGIDQSLPKSQSRGRDVETSSGCTEPILNEEHHEEIFTEVKSLAANWERFAGKLHLSIAVRDTIKENYPRDAEKCLSEALKEWLLMKYDYKKHGKPTWEMLAKAVQGINNALYEEIAEKHSLTISY